MSSIKKLTLLHSTDMHGDFLSESIDQLDRAYLGLILGLSQLTPSSQHILHILLFISVFILFVFPIISMLYAGKTRDN